MDEATTITSRPFMLVFNWLSGDIYLLYSDDDDGLSASARFGSVLMHREVQSRQNQLSAQKFVLVAVFDLKEFNLPATFSVSFQAFESVKGGGDGAMDKTMSLV